MLWERWNKSYILTSIFRLEDLEVFHCIDTLKMFKWDYSKILEFLVHHDSNKNDSTKIRMNDSERIFEWHIIFENACIPLDWKKSEQWHRCCFYKKNF